MVAATIFHASKKIFT